MRLEEYFHTQQQNTLLDAQKLAIYEKVMYKRLHGSFQKKRSFLHIKSFAYSAFILIAIFGLYGTYFFTQQGTTPTDDILVLNGQSTNFAQADYLAKVVEFQGSFFVEKDGKMVQTSMIANGDIVSLKEGAQLTFTIDNDTKAKLIGPAKFTLQKKKGSSTYQFNLFYGNYVEIKSLDSTPQDIKLSSNKLTISKTDNKPFDYTLLTQDGRNIIKNNGAKLLVKNDGTSTNIDSKQVLAIKGNDISLFDSFEKFAKAMQKGNLSQTFSLNDRIDTTLSGNTTLKTLAEPEILAVSEEGIDNSESSTSTLSTLIPDSKIVATETQIKTITTQLSSYASQEISDLESAQNKLRIIADSFDIKLSSTDSLSKQASLLKTNITTHFLLPPKYLLLFDPLISLK